MNGPPIRLVNSIAERALGWQEVLALFARGVTRQLVTRLYFPEDSAAHASDPVLQQIDPTRRSTLIGHSAGDGRTYRFDIRLHGEGETVFFDTTLC